MVAECRICGTSLDEQDVVNAGMDELCWKCCEKAHTKPKRWTWEEWEDEWCDDDPGAIYYEEHFYANEPYIDWLESRIAELEGKKQDRLSSYKKVGEFLNSKGAPSYIWSELEKLLEPNSVFLKQRETITKLREALEEIERQSKVYKQNGGMVDSLITEIARTTLREVFREDDEN